MHNFGFSDFGRRRRWVSVARSFSRIAAAATASSATSCFTTASFPFLFR